MQDQPLMPEGAYLFYLLEVSIAGAMPSLRFKGFGDVSALERQERAALYALGRIRESLCHRIKRLTPEQAEERDFLRRLLAAAQGEGGDLATAPRWPAQALGSIVGMIRDRLAARRRAA
jgi:hypothetical protein